jgi:pimeloyl-ACP methyl ester carboxylesterase
MNTVISRDGTRIAYDREGRGAPLILVDGMFEHRATGAEMARLLRYAPLAERFTLVHFDRRGRGDSTDMHTGGFEREIEDIEVIIDAVGGRAAVFGISSGAALVFEAALRLGDKIDKVVLYEPPYNDDPEAKQNWRAFRARLGEALQGGKPEGAVAAFMGLMGVTDEQMGEMRGSPMWGGWVSIAHTIAYDAGALGDDAAVPTEKAAKLAQPALVLTGETTPYPFMVGTAEALVRAMPNARHEVLAGQGHEVTAEALAPALMAFLG